MSNYMQKNNTIFNTMIEAFPEILAICYFRAL